MRYVTYGGKQCTEYSIAQTELAEVTGYCPRHQADHASLHAAHDVYGVSGFYSSLPAVGANGVEKVFVPEPDLRD